MFYEYSLTVLGLTSNWIGNFVWEQKLKFTKLALKEWVKQYMKSPSNDRIEALKNLEAIQMEMDETGIT